MRGARALLAVLALGALVPQMDGARARGGAAPIPTQRAQAIRSLPHDRAAFTEGLFIDQGELFESTGEEGRSSVRRVDLASGKVLEQANIPSPLFGEGIAPWNGQILSLTWRDGLGFRFSRKGFGFIGRFTYPGEGWGMTTHQTAGGTEIIMSDGTSALRFVDPAGFTIRRFLKVTAAGRPVDNLNELEWVDGEILANVWQTDRIARIDPATGHVVGWIDLSALHRQAGAFGSDQVANGIAWDAQGRHLYVTGKEWPVMFEIRPPREEARKGRP